MIGNRRIAPVFLVPVCLLLFLAGCSVTRIEPGTETKKKEESGLIEGPRGERPPERKQRDDESRTGGGRHAQNISIDIFYGPDEQAPLTEADLGKLEQVTAEAYRGFKGYRLSEIMELKRIKKAKTVEVRGTGEKTGQLFQLLKWKDIIDPAKGLVLAPQSNGNLKLIGSNLVSSKEEQVQDVVKITVNF